MELKTILQGIDGIKAKGDLSVEVKDVTNDSRKVKKGSMFIAIKGFETDGHKYIDDVIEKGPTCKIRRYNNFSCTRYKNCTCNCKF